MLKNSRGYWKDVGPDGSHWEVNMEHIDPNNALGSHDRHWKIYSRKPRFTTKLLLGTWPHQVPWSSTGCSR